MNEKPQSNWKQLLTGKRKWLAWFALLAVIFFVVVWMLGSVSGKNNGSGAGELILFAALAAIIGSVFVLLLVQFARWLCCWRNFRRFLFGVACFITLIAFFYAEENWRGKRAWENFQREAAAKGERFDLESIIPPPVPDGQNVAAAPLFKELCNELDPEWRRLHTGPNGITNDADRLKLSQTRANEQGPKDAPANWAKGQRTDLKAWQEYYRNPKPLADEMHQAFAARYGLPPTASSNSPSAAPITNEVTNEFPVAPQPQTPAADVLLALSRYDALVEELRAACERPQSRFPIRYEDGFSALLPHLSRLKGINQVLALRATAELEAGQSDKAAADVMLILRVADLIREEPLFISQLVRLAQIQIAVNPLWEGLAEHRWTDAQLVGFERQLNRSDFLADYQLGMRGERGLFTWTIDYMRRQRDMIDKLAMPETATDPESAMLERIIGPALFHLIPKGWFEQNKVSIGRMHLEFILPAVNRDAGLVSPSAVQKLSATMDERLKRRSPYNWFGAMLLPALGNASDRFARGQASVGLARVAFALERHRLARGQYPETLDALAPQFIAKVPHDVINGQPFKYRRTDGGAFILYSVGWNESDEGGTVALSEDQRSVDWKNGDWVWQMPAR